MLLAKCWLTLFTLFSLLTLMSFWGESGIHNSLIPDRNAGSAAINNRCGAGSYRDAVARQPSHAVQVDAAIVRHRLVVTLGNADADGECKTRISNCKFNGYIRLCVEFNRPTNPSMRVGGIMGNEANSREALYMSNCSTSGDIEFESKVYISRGAVGGIAANFANQGSVNNCVSSMNITINSPNNRLSKCFVGGICCDGFNKTKDDEINLTLNRDCRLILSVVDA